ncbi:Proton glutamate symport protein [Oceanibacterium hippocampi]|uniref:Proton glutamate symport protein n=2 Tax=Oceanibacterium hippocampi TaxID=745714 RepID=A0A1Y5S1S4_9PROT|nr:Proton glutamate symport protein [Oceanibacterium hippocampi]
MVNVAPELVQGGARLQLLRGRLWIWVRGRLWLQVVAGLVLGVAVGVLLGPGLALVPRDLAAIIGEWLAVPGAIFLGLIAMVLVPLVLVSIIQGLTGTPDSAALRQTGFRFAIFVVATTALAAIVGIWLAVELRPGSYVDLGAIATDGTVSPGSAGTVPRRAPELIANLIPSNPAKAITEHDMLAIVVLAVLTGIACRQANPARVGSFLRFLDGLLEVAMTIVRWAMFLAPWAVFGLMARLVSQVGIATVAGMAVYVLAVLAGLILLLALYLVLVAIMARQSPWTFLKAIGSVQLLAFSTSSSAAVMPVSMQTAVAGLGVPQNLAGVVIPLGATVNMAGTALYQAVAVVFLAQMSGVALSPAEYGVIVATLVVSSIGAPGTPGVSIVILANIVGDFGIPSAGLVLILGVDRILDMARTVVNVTGDLAACVVLSALQSPAADEDRADRQPEAGEESPGS